jgi:hypothetical protein
MATITNTIAEDGSGKPAIGVYDPTSHTMVTAQAGTVSTDATTGIQYAPVATTGGSGSSDVAIHDNGTPANHLAIDASGNAQVKITNANSNGQATMANSAPVVVASDQSNLPTNLKQVNGSTLSLGQTTMASSLPVAIASNQGAVPTSAAAAAFADGAIATLGLKADTLDVSGSNTDTLMAFMKGLVSLAQSAFMVPYYIKQGQGFVYSTGTSAFITATNANLTVCSLSIFNASGNTKTIYVYSIQEQNNEAHSLNTPSIKFRRTTADPSGGAGFTGTPVVSNMSLGNATTSIASLSCTASGATTSITETGTLFEIDPTQSTNSNQEYLSNGAIIAIPPGNGLEINTVVVTAADIYNVKVRAVEF